MSKTHRIFGYSHLGVATYEVRATVPAWWVAKLDTRAAWQKAGMARPPMAQRPW